MFIEYLNGSVKLVGGSVPAPTAPGPMLFLLGGWPGAGKSNAAAVLEQSYGAVVLSMSQALGEILTELDPNADLAVKSVGWFHARPHLRPKLVHLGATLRNHISPAFLMIALRSEIHRFLSAGKLVVVDGVRHPEEFAFGKEMAQLMGVPGYSVRIIKEGQAAPEDALERLCDDYQHNVKLTYDVPTALRQGLHELIHELRTLQAAG